MSISRIPISGTETPQVQAAIDRLVAEVNRSVSSAQDAKGKRVTNVSRPVSAGDAVPLGYMKQYINDMLETDIKKLIHFTVVRLQTPLVIISY